MGTQIRYSELHLCQFCSSSCLSRRIGICCGRILMVSAVVPLVTLTLFLEGQRQGSCSFRHLHAPVAVWGCIWADVEALVSSQVLQYCWVCRYRNSSHGLCRWEGKSDQVCWRSPWYDHCRNSPGRMKHTSHEYWGMPNTCFHLTSSTFWELTNIHKNCFPFPFRHEGEGGATNHSWIKYRTKHYVKEFKWTWYT